MNFQTKIEPANVSIYNVEEKIPGLTGPQGSYYDIENADFTVFWNVCLDVRDWGVKDISWMVTDIKGSFDVVLFDEKGDAKGEPIHYVFDFAEFKENVEMDIDLSETQSLSVDDLDIDFKQQTVRVY